MTAREKKDARVRNACPNCGSTEWTLRLGLGLPRPDGRPVLDVCNVCSPAKPRPRERFHALRWRWRYYIGWRLVGRKGPL